MTYPTDILFPIRRVRGFSLIELMIVVAIVAILASVAYPSYRDSVLKGRRGEARAALAELMQQQERYMTQHNKYLTFSAGATGTRRPTSRQWRMHAFTSARRRMRWLQTGGRSSGSRRPWQHPGPRVTTRTGARRGTPITATTTATTFTDTITTIT